MARNGSGTYSRVNTFISGSTITAAGHNQNWADLENEMTNSVAADGQTTMTGALKASNGTVSAPSLTFGADTNTGLYRSAADTMAVAIGGVQVGTFGSTGYVGLGGTPIGGLFDYAGSTAPTGWLLCYGQAISRTTYAALFAVLSTTFGVGDGSTTFNLPDCRGRVAAGKDDMGGSSANRLTNQSDGLNGDTLGATGGTETHTLTTAQLAAHTHAASGTTSNESATHTHAVSGTTAGQSASHQHNFTGQSGSAQVQSGAGSTVAAFGTSTQITDVAGNDHTHTYSSTSGGQSVNHTHTFSITSGSAGSDSAHNNVQPTIIFNKIIFAGV